MQKRNQDFVKNHEQECFNQEFERHSENPTPKKRARMVYSPEVGALTSMALPQKKNKSDKTQDKKSPSSSPESVFCNNELSSCEPNVAVFREPVAGSNKNEKVNSTTSGDGMSPSFTINDNMEKRSAFREVSRSRPDNYDDIHRQSQINRENIILQANNSKYYQPRACSSMYTAAEYSYLRNSFLPMVIPRGGAISNYQSLHEAARWQHAATAAHYAAYYQQLSPKTTYLKSDTERYMEMLNAREKAQADGLALRCAMDKSTHSLSPDFSRRMPEPLTSPTAGIVAYPCPEDVLGSSPAFPWQRPVISRAVFPLSSSMVDSPSENWCAKCNASFRMTSDLVYHMRTHHKRNGVDDSESKRREEKLKCNICNETFRERHHLTRHMTSHVNG